MFALKQHSRKKMGFGIIPNWVQIPVPPLSVCDGNTNYLNSVGLSSLICQMKIIIASLQH